VVAALAARAAAASASTSARRKFAVLRRARDFIDYKKVEMLQPFVQDRGKFCRAA